MDAQPVSTPQCAPSSAARLVAWLAVGLVVGCQVDPGSARAEPPPLSASPSVSGAAAPASSSDGAEFAELSSPEVPAGKTAAPDPWASPEECENALLSRRARRDGFARIASWNLRWFPDGVPGRAPKQTEPTDTAWLACVIAILDVDVVAVQEVKANERARARLKDTVALLDRHTAGSWKVELDECPHEHVQHVGLLYNARRVRAEHVQTYAELNPHDEACKDSLRPGLGAHLRFAGGLSLHLVSVHLKSGPERRSYELRDQSVRALGRAVLAMQGQVSDPDVVFAGDWNTMGCSRCSPKLSAADEIAQLARALQHSRPTFDLVSTRPGCSHYYRGRPGLLDHFVVSSSLRTASPRAEASGYCAAQDCEPFDGKPRALRALSDHCPVVLELADRARAPDSP